jgi:hypothetical protein
MIHNTHCTLFVLTGVELPRLGAGPILGIRRELLLLAPHASVSPPLLLHRRLLRFSLTLTFSGNKLLVKFRRLRRDSRSLVRAQFR